MIVKFTSSDGGDLRRAHQNFNPSSGPQQLSENISNVLSTFEPQVYSRAFKPFIIPNLMSTTTFYKSIQFRGSSTGEIVQKTFTYDLDGLAPNEVIIKVTASGLCFTDILMLEKDMVLGHEGVGIVQAVGSGCKNVKVGDRVGWGGTNTLLLTSITRILATPVPDTVREQAAAKPANFATAKTTPTAPKLNESWLFEIPPEMTDIDAAPLMCAGATVWSPIIRNCKCFDRVGVIGFGGLGHLVIQFLRKMGCEVVVFSTDGTKREEAISLGTNEFYCVKGLKDYGELGIKPVDRMLICTSVKIQMGQFYPVLKPRATIISLTVGGTVTEGDPDSLTVPYAQHVLTGITLHGSVISPRLEHQKMLDFAARNEIHVMAEKFPMTLQGVNEAVEKLRSGKMRYRGVLVPNLGSDGS
ncbi:hypothetical protein D9758_010126 [Tetrapyrgos nigripes]|uniref:Enoyl reductase (ER) domain-containing protein n=1 Tax=Tetrapyrgos nigripes TaxID=182062 RepID=A0A8H5CTW0_9AGAR|nr:hypothetical protein D9758_010126 [Tetrapyrgos nigripes]